MKPSTIMYLVRDLFLDGIQETIQVKWVLLTKTTVNCSAETSRVVLEIFFNV